MNRQIEFPVMLSLKEAEQSGLTRFTLLQLVKAGKIKFIRVGAGKRGKILINAQSLCDFMAGGAE